MMKERKGEKLGWLLGWTGGFLWLGGFSVWMIASGRVAAGLSGAALFALSLACIGKLGPWRFPLTPYWKLMLPIYALLFCSVGLAFSWFLPAMKAPFSYFQLFWLLPCLSPLFTLGKRTWNQGGEPKP